MDKKQAINLMKEVAQVLNEWDFLGVADSVSDEYDCMVGPLCTLVLGNAPESEIVDYITTELSGHFGYDSLSTESLAQVEMVAKKIKTLGDPSALG